MKAGMVDSAELYEWSSYPARIGLRHCDWLDEPATFGELAGLTPGLYAPDQSAAFDAPRD
nr:hypothetical protein [Marinobacter gelidimuriae]